jgi:GcrA cell cycle regulator
MTDFNWTDERIADLTKRWADGESAAQIAMAFGGALSRCAVLGKIHRLGVPKRRTIAARVGRPRAAGAAKAKPEAMRSAAPRRPRLAARPLCAAVASAPSARATERRLQLVDLEADSCRWPHGDPRAPDFFFCGDAGEPGMSYCGRHCRAGTMDVEPVRRLYRPARVRR